MRILVRKGTPLWGAMLPVSHVSPGVRHKLCSKGIYGPQEGRHRHELGSLRWLPELILDVVGHVLAIDPQGLEQTAGHLDKHVHGILLG